jgi:adenosylmethionine-8-amino-7-oxononanoate aminotransferase
MQKKYLQRLDSRHLWHPYTNINVLEKSDFPIIKSANGIYLYDVEGKAIIDGISSWWCVNFGHSHPKLINAIKNQAEILQHSILGGMSHLNVIKLSEELAKIAPHGLNHSFFAGDGSSATEAALKIAVQYWQNIGVDNKNKFICLENGYHGDTLGAVSVGYIDRVHRNFKLILSKAYRAQSPRCTDCRHKKEPSNCNAQCFDSMERLILKHHDQTAGVIIEPLCQGAAGINIYPKIYLQKLRKLCDEYNLLLIADEIAVGFARTGAMFACSHAGITPDLMLLGKGLTGGYLPMSAVMTTAKVYNSFRSDESKDKTFYYGHTFTGNPITSALALATIALYKELNILEKIGKVIPNAHPRFLGMIGAIEFDEQEGGSVRAREICKYALMSGLFIRPLGAVVYLWPPLVSTIEELDRMFYILKKSIPKNKIKP